MGKFKDITGLKINRLTILNIKDRIKSGNTLKIRWNCLCSCGNLFFARGDQILNNSTKSCGCLNNEKRKQNSNKRKLPVLIAKMNLKIGKYKTEARRRQRAWSLTNQEAYTLFQNNCFYCNKEPNDLNGIDRVNNKEGYTLDNTVSCCSICNTMKMDLNVNRFINHINLIQNKQNINELVLECFYEATDRYLIK